VKKINPAIINKLTAIINVLLTPYTKTAKKKINRQKNLEITYFIFLKE